MTQAPTPRGPLGQLIEDAKLATGKQWRVVESESGIPLSSIQAWISGRSGEPSLRGLLHLARYLKIPPAKLAEAALVGYVPPLKVNAAANGRGDPLTATPDLVDAVAAKAGKRGAPGPRQPRPRPSRGG